MADQTKLYFTAGPARLPTEVRQQVRDELLDYRGMGIGVMEMSHRSREFDAIIDDAEANLRKLLAVPDNYSILFMHGGAKTQFDSVVMNLCPELKKSKLDYIVHGSWSKMAAVDAEKYAQVSRQTFSRMPKKEELTDNKESVFRFYCDNETIQGIEFNYVPQSGNGQVVLVSDMTSNFLSRPVDVSKFGVIFAGAQKNCGLAGLCIVIVRKDLVGRQMDITPTIQNYKVMQDNRSLYNTPLTLNIYVANLCFKWMLERGGLPAMDQWCRDKSNRIYNFIAQSGGFYTCPVENSSRSRMNVVFLLKDPSLESKFLEESKQANLFELKGHRSVGGFRASLYHGVETGHVERLIKFMREFQQRYENK